MEHKPHIHPWKQAEVTKLQQLFKQYSIIGIANLQQLPAATYQIIRKNLRGKVEFIVTRKDFMIKVLQELQPKNYEKIIASLNGVPALLFTKENPFTLYKLIDKSKSDAFAKPGQIAPYDIGIEEGPTKFAPGPMIAEFGQLGIKTEVKEGKIAVKTAKTLVEAGKVITDKVAAFLQKIDIKPMKVGMDIALIYEHGDILTKEVLGVSEEMYIAAIQEAVIQSMNLAINAGYVVKETAELFVKKAHVQARSVAKAGKILNEETVGEALATAEAQAEHLGDVAGVQ
ncbi:MAG: 50S ribosomal protein L10 [Nanoarchaeota archaeon]|nr:50S ribosomal protein L10 [Nanoarchaeota archaeon]